MDTTPLMSAWRRVMSWPAFKADTGRAAERISFCQFVAFRLAVAPGLAEGASVDTRRRQNGC
jgi:hypothetical protein